MVRLSVDFECPARDWWKNGGQELWEAITEGFDGSKVIVDDDLAASWLAEAAAVSGWADGPSYAPHPIRAEPVNPEDIDL
jgi:hypothetical protein